MSANAWLIIAVIGFSLSGIALIAAVIMFVRMNVPAIIGDLTGKTVARKIRAIRETNKSSGDKRFRSSAVNMDRGTLTEKVIEVNGHKKNADHMAERLDKTSGPLNEKSQTRAEIISTSDEKRTDMLKSNITDGLRSEATEVLNDAVSNDQSKETEVLSVETTILSDGEPHVAGTIKPVEFKIIRNIVVIHSDEVIE